MASDEVGPLLPPDGPLNATLIDWKPDARLHRVHDGAWGPAEFNRSRFGNARFSPLFDNSGNIVPTLYAGTTLDCALMETIFHDVPYASGLKTVSKRSRIAGHLISRIQLETKLTVIDLSAIALRKLGISRTDLLETEKDHYPASREWARTLYSQYTQAQGLLWTSRQDDRSLACILFGDRIAAGSLASVAEPLPLLHPDGSACMEILTLARRLNVEVVD
jgi:hypothetical protein